MIKDLLSGLLNPVKIGHSVDKFGKQLPGKVSGYLQQKTASSGATSAPPPENRYTGSLRLRASMSEAMSWLDRFAMLEIESDKWQRTTSLLTPVGPDKATTFVQYKSSQPFSVKLKPMTMCARANENLKKSEERGRYDNCVENISYSYVVRLNFTGGAAETLVEYQTIERIAADGKSKRDLATHYSAPTMPHQFGAIGEKFLRDVSHASF
jgi:hypothetical protein